MSNEFMVIACKHCKHFISDGSLRRGYCELKKSRIDKWGQEVPITRMASSKACKKAEPKRESADAVNLQVAKSLNSELSIALFKAEHDRDRYKRKIMELNAENKMLRLQIFAFVRNSAVLPVGRRLNKSEQEITDKTFETIEAAKNMIDVEAVKTAMNLATKKENRFNNDD